MKEYRIICGVMLIACAVLVAGCITTPAVPPEDLVRAQVGAFCAGLVAADLDVMMASFAEEFEHYEWGDKEGAKEFLEEAVDMGYLEDMEIASEDMEIELDDDATSATAYPVDIEGAFGSATLEFTLGREEVEGKCVWLITGMDVSGV